MNNNQSAWRPVTWIVLTCLLLAAGAAHSPGAALLLLVLWGVFTAYLVIRGTVRTLGRWFRGTA